MLPDGPAWLFCPADRPRRFAAAAAAADVVILDLEDGVAAGDKTVARENLVATRLDPARTMVRLNPVGTRDHDDDVRAVAAAGYSMVMLAKAETPAAAAALAPWTVVALCETPAGVLHASTIAAVENVRALMWGAEDLIAGLGGRTSRDLHGRYHDVVRQARALVQLAAAAGGKAAIDAVHLDIGDTQGLAEEASEAAAIGFAATACIHPTQIPVIRASYRPRADEIAWSQRVLAAAEEQPAVFAFEGRMIDEPVLRQARAVLLRAAVDP